MSRQSAMAERIESIQGAHDRCIVMGCTQPTRAAAKEGLDLRLCRRHYEYNQRHGSPFRGSYTASELRLHRQAATHWMKSNRGHRRLSEAVERIRILYRSAGPFIPAFRLKGLPPEERARKAWARLREAGIHPEKIIHAWLTIHYALQADPEAVSDPEFRRVQTAKLVHRLASGTHKSWTHTTPDGRKRTETLSVYPRSRGRILSILGQQIEWACEGLNLDED